MTADTANDLSKAVTEHRKTTDSLTRLMTDLELRMRPGPIKESMALLCRQARFARKQAQDLEKALKEEVTR